MQVDVTQRLAKQRNPATPYSAIFLPFLSHASVAKTFQDW